MFCSNFRFRHAVHRTNVWRNRSFRAVLGLIATAAMAGCAGGGADTEINAVIAALNLSNYTGPAPATPDVQAFRINLWDNIRTNDRCGACHSVDGGQSPMFARSDDVNFAYAEANFPVTDLQSPADSQMVTKVAGGHNCWVTDDSVCADILTTWITAWAGDLAAGGDRSIVLQAPVSIRDPGASRHFPPDPAQFGATVYPLLTQFCSGCHASDTALQQSPFFAENAGPDALALAYEAVKSKIDLNDPSASRLVIRLRDEFHNCWTTSCQADATSMETQIVAFAARVPIDPVNPLLVTSKALTLYEGTLAAGGNRYEANIIANYEFKTGLGNTAFDTSGVDPAMDLTISGNVDWFGGWGLNFNGGKAQASTAASAKLHDMIKATGEYAIETWVAPSNVVQEDTRIVSYSGSPTARNFNLGQTLYNYDFFNTVQGSSPNGDPQLSTPNAAEVLQATLQHVVVNFDPVTGREIYVNGVLVQNQDPTPGGSLAPWDDTFAFVLGNEVDSNSDWSGVIRLVAIHNRTLTSAQVLQNFEAGVGEKFFLLFSVEHLLNVPESYIVFQASQFDSYAYLFNQPIFISLDPTAQPNGIDIRGLRIGLNGEELPVGQSYANLDTTISSLLYDPFAGQPLASIGAVLPLENGPDADEFFLTFDVLGSNNFTRPAPVTPPAPLPQDLAAASDIGVRTFDEINATMAAITEISPLEPNVLSTYTTIKQSLPAVETIEAFLSSHQIAIAQLAIEYCNALIENSTLRATVFPGFPFTSPVTTAYPGNQDLLLDPLLDRVIGTVANSIGTQPDRTSMKTELSELINGLPLARDPNGIRPGLANGGGSATRTQTIAKATCSAVLGSAAMLVQ
ncbi:MAG: LamG domain-containing protein [Gammaproteobacteria bacterium]|nr:MAG: LamG domain-containing protein [Gammaproteobacteria bacterium]